MKGLAIFILCLAMISCGPQPPAGDSHQKSEAIFVLIENGGTVALDQQDDALSAGLHLLQQLTKLARRKATRHAQVHILLSALPNRIAWSGTPRQLLEQADTIKGLITFKPSFSDLVMAFEQINTTINLTQPDSVRLYWVGPTIHVPFQTTSSGSAIEVKVPQEVPASLALAGFADRLTALKIMRVHPDQDQMLQAYLASIGILKRAKFGDLDFALLGEAQTRAKIEDLL
jgi:hypothetical protein